MFPGVKYLQPTQPTLKILRKINTCLAIWQHLIHNKLSFVSKSQRIITLKTTKFK